MISINRLTKILVDLYSMLKGLLGCLQGKRGHTEVYKNDPSVRQYIGSSYHTNSNGIAIEGEFEQESKSGFGAKPSNSKKTETISNLQKENQSNNVDKRKECKKPIVLFDLVNDWNSRNSK